MDTNPQVESQQGETALERLQFSPPTCIFESSATYRNLQTGQEFKITTQSKSEESLRTFLEAGMSIFLELKHEEESLSIPMEESGRSSPSQYEEPEEEPVVTIGIEVLEPGGFEPPYRVAYQIDPGISQANRTSPQAYVFPSTSSVTVNLHADSGAMTARLRRRQRPARVDNFNNPGSPNASLNDGSSRPATFVLRITGEGQYDMSGTYVTSS